jgi:hypothetical protein
MKKFCTLHSNALWKETTYLMHNAIRYDILTVFTKIKEDVIKSAATTRWTPANQVNSLRPEHLDLFYARILGKVVISSITNEFYTTLQNYAGEDLASDGPLLLWLILTHFHTSKITYQESLKHLIRTRNLAMDHKDDIEAWLRKSVKPFARATNYTPPPIPTCMPLLPLRQQRIRVPSSTKTSLVRPPSH